MTKKGTPGKAASSSAASASLATSGFRGATAFGSGSTAFAASSPAFGASPAAFGSGSGKASTPSLSYVYEPPDLAPLSEPDVVVAFKNLQKKDPVTKAKALDELSSYIAGTEQERKDPEDAFINTWIQLYPRTSVDNDRRVRQNAHSLQGLVALAAGKRIAKYMPAVVGAWLCGTQDNDKLVARAAQAAFKNVFSSTEKQAGVWKAYQRSVLDYCRMCVCDATADSLSDKRTTRPDDAESKYSRVVSSALLVLTSALQTLDADEIGKYKDAWTTFLESAIPLVSSEAGDPAIRKSLYRLLAAALSAFPEIIDLRTVSRYLVKEGLNIGQKGPDVSLPDYIQTLLEFTKSKSEIWTTAYSGTGVNAAYNKLCLFLAKGTAGLAARHWQTLSTLLEAVPEQVWTASPWGHNKSQRPGPPILWAMSDGASKKENLRPSNDAAWVAYLKLCKKVLSLDAAEEHQKPVCTDQLLPLTTQYITPSPKTEGWRITGRAETIAFEAAALAYETSAEAFDSTFASLSQAIVEAMQISQPEQSKDYAQSQDALAALSQRWYPILQNLFTRFETRDIGNTMEKLVGQETEAAIKLLRSRNGKPYGAAAALEVMSRCLPQLIRTSEGIRDPVVKLIREESPLLMDSPSGPYLLRTIDNLRGALDLDTVYNNCLEILLQSKDDKKRSNTLILLLSKPWPENEILQELLTKSVLESLEPCLSGRSSDWTPIQTAVRNPKMPRGMVERIFLSLISGLDVPERISTSLDGLNVIIRTKSGALLSQISDENGVKLLMSLFSLTQSNYADDVSEKAMKLKQLMDEMLSTAYGEYTTAHPLLRVVQQGILDTTVRSISIHTLVAQATEMIQNTAETSRSTLISKLLPDSAAWREVAAPFLSDTPDSSISLTNPLGGAVYLVQPGENGGSRRLSADDYDLNGLSAAMRMIVFSSALIEDEVVWQVLSDTEKGNVLEFLAVATQLISDHFNVPSRIRLWHAVGASEEENDLVHVDATQRAIAIVLSRAIRAPGSVAMQTLSRLQEKLEGFSCQAYYSARAHAALAMEAKESIGSAFNFDQEARLQNLRKSTETVADVAFLATIPESMAVLKAFNEIMSDLSGTNIGSDQLSALRRLVVLNTLAANLGDSAENIPQQRLVFFTKHLVVHLKNAETSLSQQVVAESLKALNFVVPLIKDLYGEFWEGIVTALLSALSSPSSEIITLHAALRLCKTLSLLVSEDAADDLQELWKEKDSQRTDALVALLTLQASLNDSHHQPLRQVNELLGRLLSKNTAPAPSITEGVFSAMASESSSLQKAAYNMLYEEIRVSQAQISVDFAMGDQSAPRIPEELLSLLMEVPSAADFVGLATEPDLPGPVLRYLLSWKLVFAHWSLAGYRVQSAYVDSVKEADCAGALLSLIFEVLIAQRPSNSPANPSKFAIAEYALDSGSDPAADALWLLSNLYYLALLHVPGLVKAWWRDSCPRALSAPVESLTAKHFSPLVASAELDAVARWEPNPDSTTQLEVRANWRAREVVATYPVDEQHMAIRVALPRAYPLDKVVVATERRVAADERHWNAWLSTAGIAANFASTSQGVGCVIDALTAWRKNVVAALKGHSECAICYSVVSAEGQLPAKRCGTCKNLFHGSCLFRWFKSSSTSSCPLCRNMFNYA